MGTIEKQYDRDFGVRSDKQLGTFLKEQGVASLNDLIRSDLEKKPWPPMGATSLLLTADTLVTCPRCEQEFALAEGFAKKALESVEAASGEALAQLRVGARVAAERQAQQIAAERDAAHEQALAQVRELAAKSFAPQIEALTRQLADSQTRLAAVDQREVAIAAREKNIESRIADQAAIRAAELVAGERQGYEKRLAEQGQRLQTLQAEQLALRQERQQLQDEKAALALEVQRQVDAKLGERDASVRAQEQERSGFEKAELQKKLEDVSGQLADAQRKIAQGSQQTQGEVLELAIEENLARVFSLDTIEAVKKGVRGGDVIQRVTTRTGQTAGVLLWEMKRAGAWSPGWVVKLKEDMRGCGADIGVLVTTPGALPRGWEAGAAVRIARGGVGHDVSRRLATRGRPAFRHARCPQAAAGIGRQGREDGSGVRLRHFAAVRAEAARGV